LLFRKQLVADTEYWGYQFTTEKARKRVASKIITS